MKRLNEIKTEYAIEKEYNSWDEFISDLPIHRREDHYDKITELYAREVAQASLEKAAENARTKTNRESTSIVVDKESIANPKNITML
ncbi:hypothetical protein CMU86_11600 [Elizabethkingia anophelis]|nr:hypothetical protein [Elizabethkingia anophelis]